MARAIVRDLILPTALTVTTFVVVAACGGDDDETQKTSGAVVACAELPSNACQKCKDDNGKATCGPNQDCYSTTTGGCTAGNNT